MILNNNKIVFQGTGRPKGSGRDGGKEAGQYSSQNTDNIYQLSSPSYTSMDMIPGLPKQLK